MTENITTPHSRAVKLVNNTRISTRLVSKKTLSVTRWTKILLSSRLNSNHCSSHCTVRCKHAFNKITFQLCTDQENHVRLSKAHLWYRWRCSAMVQSSYFGRWDEMTQWTRLVTTIHCYPSRRRLRILISVQLTIARRQQRRVHLQPTQYATRRRLRSYRPSGRWSTTAHTPTDWPDGRANIFIAV